jgi:hypothetical protein
MAELILEIHPGKATLVQAQRYLGFIGEDLVVDSHQPFLDGARELLQRGYDPETILVMRHAGSKTDSLRGKIGEAAKWTVTEPDRGKIQFRKWAPPNFKGGSELSIPTIHAEIGEGAS